MTPAERRTALVRLLAQIDQQMAECEALASQPVLSYDEEEYVAVQLACGVAFRNVVGRLRLP